MKSNEKRLLKPLVAKSKQLYCSYFSSYTVVLTQTKGRAHGLRNGFESDFEPFAKVSKISDSEFDHRDL